MLMQNLPFYNRTVAKIITFLLPTACEVAGCYFDFSGSGMICQAGLPSTVVARRKGNRKKMLVVSVEKGGELWWKIWRLQYATMEIWLI